MIKAEVIIDNTAWKKKIRNITLLFNKILKNLPKKYILKNKKTIITVLLSSNSKIKKLNRIFRKKTKLQIFYLSQLKKELTINFFI